MSTNATKRQNKLLSAMQQEDFYPHPVKSLQKIETHISTIFLTGKFAYKIKKPISLGFLDFTTLQSREHYCRQEIRLNRRFAPTLYLNVVPICEKRNKFSFCDGNSNAIEYAVKMKQFDPQLQLDQLLDNKRLSPETMTHKMEELAKNIATFHGKTEPAKTNSDFGNPDNVLKPMLDNFAMIQSNSSCNKRAGQLEKLKQWILQSWQGHKPFLEHRKKQGSIRECHGDLHLGNIAIIDSVVTLFDGIEFNEHLRWIDTANEIAFLLMDLESRDEKPLANRVLNTYLAYTGDYALLRLLPFYKVYRALVRAKVAAIQAQQQTRQSDKRPETQLHERCFVYIDLAESYTKKQKTALLITHGFSGSGKSWGSKQLADDLGFIHIRSDVERKRLQGMTMTERTPARINSGIYSSDATHKTYQRLFDLAEQILRDGKGVIVDATFLYKKDRDCFSQLGEKLQIPNFVLYFRTETRQLLENITNRTKLNQDASDASIDVLKSQQKNYIPLQEDENIIYIDYGETLPIKLIKKKLS
jgi:aminoglycoside phosphotransferase family enzyme/adenylate kinase family enzyme